MAPAAAIAGGSQEVLRAAPEAMRGPAGSTRFAGGKAFFAVDSGWVDAALQGVAEARRVNVGFASAEYFDLLRREPEVAPWLALGRRVTFVLRGTVYEVKE
jgi:hypothetical protein